MNENTCDKYADVLIDYADGELPPNESAALAEHLAACPHCRETLAALHRSIGLAGVIWQAGEAGLAEVAVPVRLRSRRFRLPRPAFVAASILLLVGVSLIWRAVQQSGQSFAPGQNEPTIAELQRMVARAGVAMEMLGAAEYLAEQPGGQEIAKERLRYILSAYPETEAATACRSRLQSIPERKTQS